MHGDAAKAVKALDDNAIYCNEALELMPGSILKLDSVVFTVGVRLRFDSNRGTKWGFCFFIMTKEERSLYGKVKLVASCKHALCVQDVACFQW